MAENRDDQHPDPGANRKEPPPPVTAGNKQVANDRRGTTVSAERVQRRLERIAEYLDKALADATPAVAVLGGINADLAALELRIARSIEEVIAESRGAGDGLGAAPEGLEMLMKIARQVERNTRLADELTRRQET